MTTVTVQSDPNRTFTTTVTAGEHTLIVDEPISVGGDDLGPGPYEYLLASLGACTAMTIRMYARRKGWPVEQVTIALSHDRIHELDAEGCEEPGAKIDRITRRIELQGPLDDGQRSRLLEIAAKCPVHRTLSGTVRIVDEKDQGVS